VKEDFMKKTIRMAVIIMLVALTLAGCQRKKEKLGIAFLNSNASDTWLNYLSDAFTGYFRDKPEYALSVFDGRNDVVQQQDLVYTAIADGAGVLVVIPVNTDAVEPITRAAADANIPLVYLNRNPYGNNPFPPNVYCVASDSIVAGRYQAEEMGRLLGGRGNVVIITGDMGHEAAVNRTAGNEEVFKAKFPEIKILATELGSWFRVEGQTAIANA
jgi:inositol transport system substrate-binding protein